eukprot:2739181-Prymnesium_polylepis.1
MTSAVLPVVGAAGAQPARVSTQPNASCRATPTVACTIDGRCAPHHRSRIEKERGKVERNAHLP